MLKALKWTVKIALFSILVLVLGNSIRWGGKTISDQVKTHLSQAERLPIVTELKDMTADLVEDTKRGAEKAKARVTARRNGAGAGAVADAGAAKEKNEDITSSEKTKLRALIRELNSSRND